MSDRTAAVADAITEPDFRDFFENAPVGFHRMGPDGTILNANAAELALLRYAQQEYVGHHIAEFHADSEFLLEKLAAGETVTNYEAQVRCGDGSLKTVLLDASALLSNGHIFHTRAVTRDAGSQTGAAELTSRFSAIVDSSDDAILSKDLDGTIQSWNPAAERLFGYSAEEAVGQSIRMLIPQDRQDEEDRVLAALRRGDRIEHYETVRLRKDGSPIDISLSVSPVKDGRGRIVGAAKIARDISFRKRAEGAVERSQRLKDEFLSVVSHELRTPITLIAGNSRILRDRRDNLTVAQEQQAIEDLAQHAERLQSILENLLLLTRMERGDEIPVEPVHVVRLAESAASSFAARTGRQLSITPVAGVAMALAEPGLLTLVFDNLLSNAGKYSPADSLIEVEMERVAAGIRVHILDRGIGLTDDDIASLLNPFYRSPAAKHRAPGLGLGLPVCHRIMEAHGGRLEVRRRDGGGSDFFVTLPEMADGD